MNQQNITGVLVEYRCETCGKLLFKGALNSAGSVVEVKCRACKKINTFSGQTGRVHSPINNQ